jgi:hypothetical protein
MLIIVINNVELLLCLSIFKGIKKLMLDAFGITAIKVFVVLNQINIYLNLIFTIN